MAEYHEERREEINEKKKVYNQIEVDCAVCGCKVKKKGQGMLGVRSIGK